MCNLSYAIPPLLLPPLFTLPLNILIKPSNTVKIRNRKKLILQILTSFKTKNNLYLCSKRNYISVLNELSIKSRKLRI